VTWLSDAILAHLLRVADWPDLTGTRYELVEKVGQGGMGSVYLARDRELDRPVALKVLHTTAADADARARLGREARVIARLEHPGIIPVHDAGILPDGRPYYVMKLVRGKRLDEQAGHPTALSERLRIFEKVCDAVAFAHAHGVIHRDLKPQNIMLGAFGEVLVLDWGVAKEVGNAQPPPAGPTAAAPPSGATQTAHGTVLGTPGYMAPEQARGDVVRIDARTDVYALGAILHFLVTDRTPAAARSGTGPGASEPVGRRRFNRAVPRPLEAVCRKALADDPAERYAGVPELAGDVANFLAGQRVTAYPEGWLDTARRLAGKYRTVLALILAYLAMRILLLLFAGA
jgi:serine/threonine protein kinase